MAADWAREALAGWEGRWPDGVVAFPNFMAARYLAQMTGAIPPDLVYEQVPEGTILVVLDEELTDGC